LSRVAFKAEARRHIALAGRSGDDLALICFDVDHFKTINDTHGHATGDRVLTAVAEVCREHLRGSDLIGRLGGEEFAILLPKTDLDGGVLVAGKLREAVAGLSAEFGFAVSASFGVAMRGGKFDQVDAMLERADQAMYAAKRNGRNQVASEAGGVPAPVAPRRRVLKAGKIRGLNGRTTLDCTVRSIGDDGATLSVSSPLGIPDDFVLAIPGDHFESQAHVTGRSEHAVEVRFTRQ
jgi:diguanylate cyclase (GGDEF)-like protein